MFEKEHQTFDTAFHHRMEHLKVRQKYSNARRIFNSFLSVSFGDETLRLILDILHIDVYRFNLIRQAREHDQLHVKTHTHTHTQKQEGL